MLINGVEVATSLPEAVALGAIPGAKEWSKFAFGQVGTTLATIYSSTITADLYTYMSTPETVSIASTDPADTLGGLGAERIIIYGYDADGKRQNEVITLNGQTPTPSTKVYSRIYRAFNISKTGHDVLGQVYVGPTSATWTAGEPDHDLAHINNGNNQTQMGVDTVPEGYYLLGYNLVIATDSARKVEIQLVARSADLTDLSNCSVFSTKANWLHFQDKTNVPISRNPFVLPELTDFEFRGIASQGSDSVSVNASGILIPKRYITIANRELEL